MKIAFRLLHCAAALLLIAGTAQAGTASGGTGSSAAFPPAAPSLPCGSVDQVERTAPLCGGSYAITVTADAETAYWRRGDCAQAQERLRQTVMDLRQDASPQGRLQLASTLSTLGGVYRCLGNPGRAEQFYREALDLREEQLKPGDPDIAVSALNLGDCLRELRDYPGAEAFLLWASFMGQSSGPGKVCVSATAAHLLGRLYYDREEYGRALEYARKADALFREQTECGRLQPAVASTDLSLALLHTGSAREAESVSARAIAGLSALSAGARSELARALLVHAACLRKLHDSERAHADSLQARRILTDRGLSGETDQSAASEGLRPPPGSAALR